MRAFDRECLKPDEFFLNKHASEIDVYKAITVQKIHAFFMK